jgi:hypothetical protein
VAEWWIDKAGQPARRAPKHGGKSSGVYFDPDKFERAIQEQGDLVRWEQAARCPCSNPTGHADPLCESCGGQGWEYHSPLEIRAIVDRLEFRIDALEKMGDLAFGSVACTLQPVHRLNFRDRLVLLENVIGHSELTRRRGQVDRLAFPIAHTTERVLTKNAAGEEVVRQWKAGVLRLRLQTGDRTPGPVLREGLDFAVTGDGRIDWSLGDQRGTAPGLPEGPRAPGGAYAVTYYHHPSYIVSNWPYAMRTLHVQRKRPSPEHLPGPISAFAQLEARRDEFGATIVEDPGA